MKYLKSYLSFLKEKKGKKLNLPLLQIKRVTLKSVVLSYYISDMYTFDSNIETATQTYNLVCDTYDRIFKRLGLKFVKGLSRLFYLLSFVRYV